MTYRLVGPFEFDEDAVVPSAREALAHTASAIREGTDPDLLEPAAAQRPGLYLLLKGEEPAQLVISGFWVVAGHSYLAKGPMGPPDKEPPIVKQLLEAATEEVWWQRLPVDSRKKGEWTPLIVLEWPPVMAFRSSNPPPGVPDDDDMSFGTQDDEPEHWLTPVASKNVPVVTVEEDDGQDDVATRFAHLPERRSLVAVIRGHFQRTRALAQGSYELMPPEAFGEGLDALPLDTWVDNVLANKRATSEPGMGGGELSPGDRLGHALALPSGGVAFPMSGWLTRNLDLWPAEAADVRPGRLTDREVQVKWKQQMRMAVSSTIAVLILVIGFTLAVQSAAQPRPRIVPATPPPAPQPAMSVCSADYQKFVDELRCQIAHFASGGDDRLESLACGDAGAGVGESLLVDENLQVEFCGLHDRKLDKWMASIGGKGAYSFAHVAAAQACFNVLGYPHPYEHAASTPTKSMGDPYAFIEHEELGIQPLRELVAELESSCDKYRDRLASRVEGAVFATHIGTRGTTEASESAELRAAVLETAMVGVGTDARRCFEVGMNSGLEAETYSGLCRPDRNPDSEDLKIAKQKIWGALEALPAAVERKPVIDEYVSARFAVDPATIAQQAFPPLWQCHLTLDGELKQPVSSAMGSWDIPIPIPGAYRIAGGGARSQLQLDASLLAIREGTAAGPCWDIVGKRLASYTPVHPLLQPLDDAGWPSAEQQLCGQICAASHRVSSTGGAWVTSGMDLEMCISTAPPAESPDYGRGTLDRLRLPWSFARREGWIEPTLSQVCSYNLVAQNRLPSDDEGYIVNGRSPEQWAGETGSGSRIAGGQDGLAVRSIAGMYRSASARSIGACGHVALQCFTGVMMDVLGDEDHERYDWLGAWQRRVTEMSKVRRTELEREQPWCAPIQEYLSAEEDRASVDRTCQLGVEEARANAEQAIRLLATDRTAGR